MQLSDKEMLQRFFDTLDTLYADYEFWTERIPEKLFISPEILQRIARLDGFYQRPELGTEVSIHSPVVRYLKLKRGVVMIVEDWEEQYLHLD